MNWLVNKTRFVGSLLFLSTLIAVVLSACEPPSEVGITPANEIGIVFTDTITVKVSTVLTDSVRTNNGQFLMSGGFKDANFGTVSAVSGDSGGTTVTFAVAFIDVVAITLTPLGTTARYAIYDFTDAPNPTTFKVLLFDSAGARATGTVSWTARGY